MFRHGLLGIAKRRRPSRLVKRQQDLVQLVDHYKQGLKGKKLSYWLARLSIAEALVGVEE